MTGINKWPWYAQAALFVAFLIIVDVFLHNAFFQSVRKEIQDLDARIRDLKIEVEKEQAVEARKAQFTKEIQRDREKLKLLKAILPEEKETPEVVRKIQELASTSNLKIRKFIPQPVVGHGFYSDWPINIELDGSYNNLGRFFERIGKFTRIINVENLNVKGLESEDPERTLSASCTATTFVFQELQ